MQHIDTIRPDHFRFRAFGWTLALAALCASAPAAAAPGLFIVNEPWIRPAASGSTDAYMNLRSSDAATLAGVRCELATSVTMEVPDSARRGKFRTVTRIALPAGETVRLAPGQMHLRLAGIRHALKLGEHVALVLMLAAADGSTREIPLNAEVRHHSPTDDETRAHGHPGAPAAH